MKQETLEEAAERLYCTIPFSDVYFNPNNKFKKLDFINGAKWQQERMYSEEDMHNLMDEYQDYLFKTNNPVKTFKEWFEQFKKK